MSGWPVPPALSALADGPLVDEKHPDDPRKDLGAEVLYLAWWQTAGLGLVLPKLVLVIEPATPTLRLGLFSWDQTVYSATTSPFPWFGFTVNAGGDYEIALDATVPDMDGAMVAHGVTAGEVWPVQQNYGGLGADDMSLRGEFRMVSANTIGVRLRQAFAAGEGTLDDSNSPFIVEAW